MTEPTKLSLPDSDGWWWFSGCENPLRVMGAPRNTVVEMLTHPKFYGYALPKELGTGWWVKIVKPS